MSSRRRAGIDRNAAYDDEETPSLTLKDADAALYGALSRVDNKRKAIERTRFGAFKITPTGLEIGEGAEQKDWEEVGQFILQVESGIQWAIGDWLVYGIELKYGDMQIIAEKFDRDPATLHTYKQLCENIESTRRRVDLTFGHHQVVRALEPDDQDAWLKYAAEKKLSVAALRKELHGRSTPALSSGKWFSSVGRELDKFAGRDAATLKPKEKATILDYVSQVRRWLDDLEAKAKS